MTSYDFEVVNALGKTVFTSNELNIARKWARQNTGFLGVLRVECVTRSVRREVVYTPRANLREVA